MHRRDAISLCLSAIAVPAVLESYDQTPPAAPGQAAAPPTGKAPALAFATDHGMLLSPIAPAQAAAFEQVMEKVKAALAKSTNPVRKQQAAGWKVFKAVEPFQGNTLYVSIMSPTVPGADYNVFELLQESLGDADARAEFQKLKTAFGAAGVQHVLNLTTITVMAPEGSEL